MALWTDSHASTYNSILMQLFITKATKILHDLSSSLLMKSVQEMYLAFPWSLLFAL